MVDEERAQFLRNSIEANPGDTFARYALALELTRGGQPDDGWKQFRYLLDHYPDYSPTYYQAGMFLADQGRTEEARQVFTQGIEVARRLGQAHAASELEAALEALD